MVQQHTAGLLRELIAFPWICFVERKYGGLQSNWNCHNGWATPVTKEHASASFDFWAFKCGSVTGEPVLHSTAASLVHTWAITSGPGSCRTSHYSSWQYNRHHGVGTMWLFNKFVKNDFSQMLFSITLALGIKTQASERKSDLDSPARPDLYMAIWSQEVVGLSVPC